jgi:hypothetical protein
MLVLCFFNSSDLKTSLNLKHILFQNKMDSIQNNLKPEVKEETEEEKIAEVGVAPMSSARRYSAT